MVDESVPTSVNVIMRKPPAWRPTYLHVPFALVVETGFGHLMERINTFAAINILLLASHVYTVMKTKNCGSSGTICPTKMKGSPELCPFVETIVLISIPISKSEIGTPLAVLGPRRRKVSCIQCS